MTDPSPRYVLSQRAADALRPIIQTGAAFGSRVRQIRDINEESKSLPFRIELRTMSNGLHAVAPFAYGGRDVGIIVNQLVSVGPQNIKPADNVPTITIKSESWLDFGVLSTVTSFWLVITPPSPDLSDSGSWTIISQLARPVPPPSSTTGSIYDGRICALLGYWRPSSGLARTWGGGVFAFAGPVLSFDAVTSLSKDGDALIVNEKTFVFRGSFASDPDPKYSRQYTLPCASPH